MVLCLVLVLTAVAGVQFSCNAATLLSETEFLNKLNELRSKYPNGGTYSGIYYEDGEEKASTCYGYACQMFYEVFGARFYADGYNSKKDYNMGTIYAGDIVRLDAGLGPDTHSVFVTKVTSDRIYFTDANGGDKKNGIRWDASYTISDFREKFTYKVHIPGNALTGNPTHSHSYDTFAYFSSNHPHTAYYKCSCGETKEDSSKKQFVETCAQCKNSQSGISYESIENGNYYLTIPSDGRYLNTSYGKDEEGNNIHIHTFGDYDCQVYTIRDMGNGYEMMPLISTTRVVGVAETYVVNGNSVKLYTKNSGKNQLWKFQKVNGGYVIRNAQNPNLCLMPYDYGMIVSEYTGGERQIWKLEKNCTVTYDANGGTGAPGSSRTKEGDFLQLPTQNPSRQCHQFLGWAPYWDSINASYQGGQTIQVQKDMTLYAIWKANHKYTNDSDTDCNVCGANREDATSHYNPITSGKYYLSIPSDGRYLNNSYGKDEEGNNLHIHTFSDYDCQVYTIRDMGDGYEMMPLSSTTRVVGVAEKTVMSGNGVKLYTRTSAQNQLWKFQPVEGGYVIRNAQNPNLCLMPFDYGLIVSEYTGGERQIWKLEKACTISYNANGGTGAPDASRVRGGYSATVSSAKPSRTGYRFLGWSLQSGGTTASYQPNQTITLQNDTTLYAVWSACGDANGDKSVNAEDALVVLKTVVGKTTLTYQQKTNADVNGDGTVNAQDALLILQKIVGKIKTFPVEK